MNISNDMVITAAGTLNFMLFLLWHLITFRLVKPEGLFCWIIQSLLTSFVVGTITILLIFHHVGLTGYFLAMMIYFLAAFFYIFFVLGPYETSIRIRLIRELFAEDAGLTKEEILKRYHEGTILDNRLKRLLGGGDVVFKEGKYHLVKKSNMLFVLDAVAGILHAFIRNR